MTPVGSRNLRAPRRAPGPSLARHRSGGQSLSSRESDVAIRPMRAKTQPLRSKCLLAQVLTHKRVIPPRMTPSVSDALDGLAYGREIAVDLYGTMASKRDQNVVELKSQVWVLQTLAQVVLSLVLLAVLLCLRK
jgi:hypothetical protein